MAERDKNGYAGKRESREALKRKCFSLISARKWHEYAPGERLEKRDAVEVGMREKAEQAREVGGEVYVESELGAPSPG